MAKQKFTLGSGGGRGLDALISTEAIRPVASSSIGEIEISKIHANPNQPRRDFNEEALQELADSISELGVIQPITLRKEDGVADLLEFYMGKNTIERQNFIIDNLVVEDDTEIA